MDILAEAATNASRWIAGADADCVSEPALALFRTVCGASAAGSNVDADKLDHFRRLDPPRIVSTFAVRAAQRGAAEAYRAVYESGEWGPRRLAIDEALGGLRTAVYGTIDLPGCAGDARYGYFRLVFAPVQPKVVVFPHNSALVYAPMGAIQVEKMKADAARWAERAEVCVQAVGAEAIRLPRDEWPRLLASERSGDSPDLIEVVAIDGEVALDEGTEIRVESTRFATLLALSLDALLSPDHNELAIHLAAQLAADAEAGLVRLTLVEVNS